MRRPKKAVVGGGNVLREGLPLDALLNHRPGDTEHSSAALVELQRGVRRQLFALAAV